MHRAWLAVTFFFFFFFGLMECSMLGSSVHEIFRARILEWFAISFSWQLPFKYCDTLSIFLFVLLNTVDLQCCITFWCIAK